MEQDIVKIAKAAIALQDASNLSGVVHSWSQWLPAIRRDAETKGIEPNRHPVNVLIANKVSSLTGDDFRQAYDAVMAMIPVD